MQGGNEDRPRNQQEQPQPRDDGATPIVRPGMENHITEGAQRLMGAMRELLSTMTYRYEFVAFSKLTNVERLHVYVITFSQI